jgi:hypothetical protein
MRSKTEKSELSQQKTKNKIQYRKYTPIIEKLVKKFDLALSILDISQL